MLILELKKSSRYFLVKIQTSRKTLTHFKVNAKHFYFLFFRLLCFLYENGIAYNNLIIKSKLNNVFRLRFLSQFK